MARACWALGLIALAGCGAAPDSPDRAAQAQVVRVVDGDTIKVRVGPSVETVRLVGIDTPESKRPGTPVECGAKRAAAAMRALVAGRSVALRRDPTQDARDRYGRLLAYVQVGSHDAGEEMVRAGLAKVYVFRGVPFERVTTYRTAAAKARTSRAGVYGTCRGNFHRTPRDARHLPHSTTEVS